MQEELRTRANYQPGATLQGCKTWTHHRQKREKKVYRYCCPPVCRAKKESSRCPAGVALPTSGPAQASGNLRLPLLLRWNDLGGCPCGHGGLCPHSGILLTCSGAACFQNMLTAVRDYLGGTSAGTRRPVGAKGGGIISYQVNALRLRRQSR
jgi:hypothetical protein